MTSLGLTSEPNFGCWFILISGVFKRSFTLHTIIFTLLLLYFSNLISFHFYLISESFQLFHIEKEGKCTSPPFSWAFFSQLPSILLILSLSEDTTSSTPITNEKCLFYQISSWIIPSGF